MALTPPTADELLLLDVDYSTPLIWCKSPHPADPSVKCALAADHQGEFHANRLGRSLVKWEIDDPSPKTHDSDVEFKITPVRPGERHKSFKTD